MFNNLDNETFGLPSQIDQYTHEIDQDMHDIAKFKFANIPNPAHFCHELKESAGREKELMDFKKGTTTLAFRTAAGICVAVDSRASMGTFNSSETVRKIVEINEFLLGTMAGGAADCQYWEPYIAMKAREYELMHGERMTVAAASKLLSNIMYSYRGHGLSMGIMFCGVDKKGTSLFYMDDEGNRIPGDLFSVGSGSTFAYGILDSYYNWDMTKEQAITLGKRAINEAAYNDAASGGVVRVYWIPTDSDRWEKIEDGADNSEMTYQDMKKKNIVGEERFAGNVF